MKRIVMLFLSLLLLAGCSLAGLKTMCVRPTKLSKETERILEALQWNGRFYDFKTDQRIERANFRVWSLTKTGEWEQISPEEGNMHKRSEGQFAISFGDDMKNGYCFVEFEREFEAASISQVPLKGNLMSMRNYNREIHWLDGGNVIYNQPMPLVYQFDDVFCYDEFTGGLWENPEEFLDMEYFKNTTEDWEIYCMTVTFEV